MDVHRRQMWSTSISATVVVPLLVIVWRYCLVADGLAAPFLGSASRRSFLGTWPPMLLTLEDGTAPSSVVTEETQARTSNVPEEVFTQPPDKDVRKLVADGRVREAAGNMLAAQRLYAKATDLAPRFVYGWSNLGNTQTALGDLESAEESYGRVISLCRENQQRIDVLGTAMVRPCADEYVLYLNRGSVRVNMPRRAIPTETVKDLETAARLRNRPDPLVAQNLARAYEQTGRYADANRQYDSAIGLSSNEVNPFWLRAALVKIQLGDDKGGRDLLQRVLNRFPEPTEVQIAYAVGVEYNNKNSDDATAAVQRYLSQPDRVRLKFVDRQYVTEIIAWPPVLVERLEQITRAAGDGGLR